MVLGLCGCGSSEPSAGFTAPRAATSAVLVPTITGPIQGGIRGQPWAGTVEQLAPLSPYDFIQEEYFISGTAQARDEHGALTGASAAYTTRLRSDEHTSELQSLLRISYAVFCLKNKSIKIDDQLVQQ